MSDAWTDRLSEFVDGDLAADERRAVEAHLERCVECSAVVTDLRGIVARAAALEDRPPERDLWPGIAARLGFDRGPIVVPLESRRRARARRFSFSAPQLAAAAVALLVLGAVGTWLVQAPGTIDRIASLPAVGEPEPGPGTTLVAEFPGERPYSAAVAELERALEEGRDRLDPETVRVVEENLAIIERAIEETRRALSEDPDDPYLNRHLANTMQRKVDVLREATSVPTAAI